MKMPYNRSRQMPLLASNHRSADCKLGHLLMRERFVRKKNDLYPGNTADPQSLGKKVSSAFQQYAGLNLDGPEASWIIMSPSVSPPGSTLASTTAPTAEERSSCDNAEFGCCPDGKTSSSTPEGANCPCKSKCPEGETLSLP